MVQPPATGRTHCRGAAVHIIKDIQRQHRPLAGGSSQGGIIRKTQILSEPDNGKWGADRISSG
jgi:hypothetical protein